MLATLSANFPMIVMVLLIASEAAAAITQLLFPQNKGLTGALATVVKILQKLSGKSDSTPPAA